MTRSAILGTGMAVPARIVTNDDLSKVMDTSDEWISQRTGIRRRHWAAEGETGVDLARDASLRAIEAAGLSPGDIDAIVLATSTPDHFAPGNGVLLQHRLGLGPIPALDVRAQCSGFISFFVRRSRMHRYAGTATVFPSFSHSMTTLSGGPDGGNHFSCDGE